MLLFILHLVLNTMSLTWKERYQSDAGAGKSTPENANFLDGFRCTSGFY